MNKIVDFNGIGYLAATFPVSSATQTYLKTNYTNAQTGNVDVNGKNLAVTLNASGEAEIPASGTGALLGIVIAYEMDGFASVQIKGGIDEVPTVSALASGVKDLSVNTAGKIVATSGEGAVGNKAIVAKPSTSSSLFASIIL